MENYFEQSDFAAMPEQERAKALDDNAQKRINGFSYSKPLSSFDIENRNVELNQALQEIERLKSERKEYSKLIAAQWKTVNANSREVVQKFANVTETVWEINNFDTGYLEIVNGEGMIISKSRLKNGVQMNIFNKQKEAI